MDKTAQLWKSREQVLALGYPEADVEEAFKNIRLQYLQYVDLREKIEECNACPLSSDCERGIAGVQYAKSKVMVIGEAPTKEDVFYGIPYTGIAGYIFTIILDKLKVSRDELYLTNMVKCKKNGRITMSDAENCLHHLYNEIALIEPEVIITLGEIPYQLLSKSKQSLLNARGQWFEESHTPLHIPVMPTHHPEYLVNLKGRELVAAKKEIWADLQVAFKKGQLL